MVRGSIFRTGLVLLLAGSALPAAGTRMLQMRISVKFVLDESGNRASDGYILTDDQVREQLAAANEILAANEAHWRLELVEIVDVPGISEWFGPLSDDDFHGAMQQAARNDPELYHWRFDAVNFYVVDMEDWAGLCSFPTDEIILMDYQIFDRSEPDEDPDHEDFPYPRENIPYFIGMIWLHELGHYVNLCHTQGCACSRCEDDRSGRCHTVAGNDRLADTLRDLACWEREEIAQENFGAPYGELTPEQQQQVDRTWKNVMSYHDSGIFNDREAFLTEQQLARAAIELDPETGRRSHVVYRQEAPFRRGDTNADGTLDLSDAAFVLLWLFLEGSEPTCVKTADGSDDGVVSISAAVHLLNYLFLGGSAPASPFGECGRDPTPDELSCEAYAPCE